MLAYAPGRTGAFTKQLRYTHRDSREYIYLYGEYSFHFFLSIHSLYLQLPYLSLCIVCCVHSFSLLRLLCICFPPVLFFFYYDNSLMQNKWDTETISIGYGGYLFLFSDREKMDWLCPFLAFHLAKCYYCWPLGKWLCFPFSVGNFCFFASSIDFARMHLFNTELFCGRWICIII